MIYSKWLPDKGGYAYYETSERRGLGDDLPTPRMTAASDLGVASTDAGRALPLGAKLVGCGAVAKGCVTVLDRSGLNGLGGESASSVMLACAAVASAVAGVVLARKFMR